MCLLEGYCFNTEFFYVVSQSDISSLTKTTEVEGLLDCDMMSQK